MDTQVLLLLVTFTGLLLLNVPIAVSIGLAAWLTIFSLGDVPAAYVTAQRLSTGIASFPLLAIPFFILSGMLMGEGGMARRLMDFAGALMGRFPGGLAYMNTLTCMLFGAVSGSATAAVSSIGGFLIPEMERKGYRREFSVALTAASATTGLLIPPSNIMIVFAVVAGNVSLAALFLAGVGPGILMGLSLMGASFLLLRGHPVGRGEVASWGKLARTFAGALPSLVLIIIVLGGILGGVFSATEASAIAVAYALVVGVVFYRELRVRDLPRIFRKAALTTSVVMILVGCSQAMSWILAHEQIPQAVSVAILAITDNPVVILLLINLLLLLVGTFMDMTPAVLIFTPIFLPVVTAHGMDGVHFGIVMIANLCIGLCTPPVGACLFVGCSVGKTTIARVTFPMMQLILGMMVALGLITYMPPISLWLPRLLGL